MDVQQELDATLSALVERFPGSGVGLEVSTPTFDDLLLGKNLDTVIAAASTTKIVIAMALYDAAEKSEISLHESTNIGSLEHSAYASVLKDLDSDRQLRLREFCRLSMSISDNPSTQVLINRLGTERIQRTLTDIGTRSTTLVSDYSPSDLKDRIRNNTTTARDALLILRHLKSHAKYTPILESLKNSRRNTRMPYELDETIEVAHKTGSLRGLVHNIGIVWFRPDLVVSMAYLVKHDGESRAAEDMIGKTTKYIGEQLSARI